MQAWDYMEIAAEEPEELTRLLRDLGRNGWELVSVVYPVGRGIGAVYMAFLKRPLEEMGDEGFEPPTRCV